MNPIAETDEVARCPVCGAAYHTECLAECGGCAYKDCEKRARPKPIQVTVDEEPHTVLVLSRESVEQAPSKMLKKPSLNPCLKCGTQLPEGLIYCAECEPKIGESMDSRNLWPVLVMVGLIAIVVVWLAMWLLDPEDGRPANQFTVGPYTQQTDPNR